MRVLLVSPLDPKIPGKLKYLMGGESTYTRTLLDNPPLGVKYIYFEDAIKKKLIEYSIWQMPLMYLIKFRILPLGPRIMCLKINSRFDLIHAHSYPIKLSGIKTKIVLSDSSSNLLFLRDYVNMPKFLIGISYFLKKIIVKGLGIYDPDLNLIDAKLIVWSKFAKLIHEKLKCDSSQIFVIPPGIKKILYKKTNDKTFNILFVGTWFKRKGGLILLEAYEKLKKKYPKIILTIVGEVPKDVALPEGVIYFNYLPREELLSKVFPKADVLVLVPEKAEGYGVVVLEAASFGIPSIVSKIYALDEIIEHGKNGFVIEPGSSSALVKILEKLNNQILRKKMGEEAMEKFDKYFSIKKTNQLLLDVYKAST